MNLWIKGKYCTQKHLVLGLLQTERHGETEAESHLYKRRPYPFCPGLVRRKRSDPAPGQLHPPQASLRFLLVLHLPLINSLIKRHNCELHSKYLKKEGRTCEKNPLQGLAKAVVSAAPKLLDVPRGGSNPRVKAQVQKVKPVCFPESGRASLLWIPLKGQPSSRPPISIQRLLAEEQEGREVAKRPSLCRHTHSLS